MSISKCEGCGKSVHEWPIVLHRVSPKGKPFVGKCDECLGLAENPQTQEQALLRALGGESEHD